jgi:asparagine synthase (glutamine-hydrolysing)
MCGICGVAVSSIQASPDMRQRVEAMSAAIVSRGPDDSGTYLSQDCSLSLGNQRLAVRDLTPAGHMPMSNAAQSICITYNGEIYNAVELRTRLEQLGYVFRSHSDTEVILIGYEAWGDAVVQHLRGMFAFAIYDCRGTPRLLLARDPLGIKPLYYSWSAGTFVFASECKAILASGLVDRELSSAGLLAYLELGSVPAPLTVFRTIQALEAGHLLVLEWESGLLRLRPAVEYWRLPTARGPRLAYADAVLTVKDLLLESVRRHLVSDVPLGAFLSGGVDSGSIVALMREASPSAAIRTCSVVFDEEGYSETRYAHAVAQRFETEHTDIRVTAGDLASHIGPIMEALDQPSTDGVNTYFVSRAARQIDLTVALSGLGGDELFGGYPSTRRLGTLLPMLRLAQAVPGGTRAAGAVLATWGDHHPHARLGGWLAASGGEPAGAYLGLRGLFSSGSIRRLLRPEIIHEAGGEFDLLASIRHSAHLSDRATPPEVASRFELTCYMRHQLLRDTDVMSMAHSLEVRVPFVDTHVVEEILGLRVDSVPRALPKQLLRDAVSSLPPSVTLRPDKQGFSFPFDPWLRGPLRSLLNELVDDVANQLTGYLQPGACADLLQAFDAGRLHWSRVWAIAALQAALSRQALGTSGHI